MTRVVLPIIIAVLVVFGLRFGLQTILHAHDVAAIRTIDDTIQNQRAIVVTTADLTRQNSVDPAIEKVITACNTSDQQRFNTLLDSLAKNISPTDLDELTVLFYKCGHYDADRKGIMTARLEREVQILINLEQMRNYIQPYANNMQTETDTWKKIVEAEQKWTGYSNDLVTEQGIIIDLLRSGKKTTSPEVVEVLTKAGSARSQLQVLGLQIQNYRQSVQSI